MTAKSTGYGNVVLGVEPTWLRRCRRYHTADRRWPTALDSASSHQRALQWLAALNLGLDSPWVPFYVDTQVGGSINGASSKERMHLGSDMRVLKKDEDNNADKVDAHNMFDEMSLNKFLTKYGTVKEYFDSFNSWFSKMTLEEWFRVDLFICGLPLEFRNGVRLFNPKTLSDAYCLAKLQEFTHNDMIKNSKRPLLDSSKSKDSKEVVKNNMRLRDFDDSSKEDVKGKEKYSNGLIFDECGKDDVNCKRTELRSYGESGKEDVDGKEIECLELIAPIELNEELNELVELKDKNKCLEVTNNFASEKYEIEDKNKRMGLSSLVYGGEQDGSKEDNDLIVSDLVLRKCFDERYFEGQVGGYKNFNVFAYDSDVHNPSTKVVTCEDELYMDERKTENSEIGSAILKFDIWKWCWDLTF
ncbi:hypothetical protein Tco_0704794 [Tanacetum coccineum]|uniref:Uncharacterized protein n=1 Tax=Tanacetum coccineum TaxID=301880 RepID=A0ABQ4Y2S0_9ASTR